MNVLALPHEVWKDIAFYWITFPEVIRFDCAVSLRSNYFRDIYAEHEFGFTSTHKLQPHSLCNLGVWIQSKKVYLEKATIPTIDEVATVLWDNFLQASAGRVRRLNITSYTPNKQLFQSVAVHCANLWELRVSNCSSDNQTLHDILRNSAPTLEVLVLISAQDCGDAIGGLPNFPKLHKLEVYCFMTDRLDVASLIGKCPELVELHLGGQLQDFCITSAIATSCTNLQRLEFTQMFELEMDYLFIIAAACKKITHLSAFESMRFAPDQLCYILDCWPDLHTLSYWHWNDALLQALAARGESSLRHIDFAGTVSMTSVRAVTQANPRLIGICIFDLSVDERLSVDACHVLQYCSALQYLRIALYDSAMYAVLNSVALYCHNLQVLDLAQCDEYDPVILEALVDVVVPKCPQLRKLMLPAAEEDKPSWTAVSQCHADLVITYESVDYP